MITTILTKPLGRTFAKRRRPVLSQKKPSFPSRLHLRFRLALEPQRSKNLIHQVAGPRLALDPRQRQSIRAEKPARRFMLELVTPRNLCDELVIGSLKKTKRAHARTIRSGISGLLSDWYSCPHIRTS